MRATAGAIVLIVTANVWGGCGAILFEDSCGTAGAACGCNSLDDCDAGQVCFLGSCRPPGSGSGQVYLDVRPPADSGLLPQRDPSSPHDLSVSQRLVIDLRAAYGISGTLTNPIQGALYVEGAPEDDAVVLPSDQDGMTTGVDTTGAFAFAALPGFYALAFQPDIKAPNEPLTPMFYGQVELRPSSDILLFYPAPTTQQHVHGVVRNGHTAVWGAQVSATTHLGAVPSSSAVTDENGMFVIALPPGADLSTLHVAVGPADNGAIPNINFTYVGATNSANDTMEIDLRLPGEPTRVTVAVTAGDGAGVADAVILLNGTMDSGTMDNAEAPGTYRVSITTDAEGLAEARLWPGVYAVTVAPPRDTPCALAETHICVSESAAGVASDTLPCPDGDWVAADTPLAFVLREKVTMSGYILTTGGNAVANARITYTSTAAQPIQRQFATVSDARGAYSLDVDPGDSIVARVYDVTIEPAGETGLPLQRDRILVHATSEQHDVTLAAASLVFGVVNTPEDDPLMGVYVGIYAIEDGAPVLLGFGTSDAHGEFVVLVPTPSTE